MFLAFAFFAPLVLVALGLSWIVLNLYRLTRRLEVPPLGSRKRSRGRAPAAAVPGFIRL